MSRESWWTIYIDKDTSDPYKGWGRIEIKGEDIKKFNIPTKYPDTYTKKSVGESHKFPNYGSLPSRGKAGRKKFTLNLNGELIIIKAHKSFTIKAIRAWLRTWADPNSKLITPGKRTYSLNGEKVGNQAYFIYFLLNKDSSAIKIGQTKNLEKRIRTLQTSSPAKLKLLKSLQVEGSEEALKQEQSLHQKFSPIKITGEWFKAEKELLDYISQL